MSARRTVLVCLALVACTPPRPSTSLAPKYPDMLRYAGITGQLHVIVTVDREGAVRKLAYDSMPAAHELFRAAARNTIRQTRFKPARTLGIAHVGTARYALQFVLVRGQQALRPGERRTETDTVLTCPPPHDRSHIVVCAETPIIRADLTGH